MWGRTITLLERYLDVLSARQRITASNIANADTPGYRARQIDFRSEMESFAFHGANDRIPAVRVQDAGGAVKNDGNNVNLDQEMKALAENALHFTVASALLQRQIQGLRSAIREGRGG